MAAFKTFSSMTTIFIVTSSSLFFFLFNHCQAADRALIDSICKQSQDPGFCTSTLVNDVRTPNADLHGLALISISVTNSQIQDTLDRIPGILSQLSDPLGKKRLGVCQTDYNGSLGNFKTAFVTTSNNKYSDTINFVRDGTNQVIDCHNNYRRDGPIATSPIDGDDIKVFKLSEIILLIIDRLV